MGILTGVVCIALMSSLSADSFDQFMRGTWVESGTWVETTVYSLPRILFWVAFSLPIAAIAASLLVKRD
ncbi:hypothetical protein EI77_04417 [Prosthecobacter fusiformis]|uniref:Uncharacterized protein n=1 Tax=Prosthecobacter fusiformis TaxID=48464 RepID=A0A4R7RIS3_9BACT|nr:hypothetical protein EI77_04417 [Prosthecobacter fusiformis]